MSKCKYLDPLCPCQDGDECHYEGDNPWNVPVDRVCALILSAIRAERSACLQIAASYGGRDADEIAEAIGSRSFPIRYSDDE